MNNATTPVWQPVDILASLSTGEVVKQSGRLFVPRSPEDYLYDADGNLTDDGRWRYTWDAENRLISQETQPSAVSAGIPKQRLDYTYDAGGRRIAKKVYNWVISSYQLSASTLFVYDGWNLLTELNAQASNAPIRTFAWGLDLSGSTQGAGGVGGLLAIATSAATHAPTYDGNGNILGLIDFNTGTQEATYVYGPFGELLASYGAAAGATPFRFSTKYTDSETDLIYYGFRYYNPQTGRWPNRDPIEEMGGVNIYGMVGNHPVSVIDPFGLDPTWGLTGTMGPIYPSYYRQPYVPSWIPRPSPVDLSFLPAGISEEQQGLWGDYLRNTDTADGDYRKLLEFSREVLRSACYCIFKSGGKMQIRADRSSSLFSQYKDLELPAPKSLVALQSLLATNAQNLGLLDKGFQSPSANAPDFGDQLTKREFRKAARQYIKKNGHMQGWVQHYTQNFNSYMTVAKERGNAIADVGSAVANFGDNLNDYSSFGVLVRWDRKNKCWFALGTRNGGKALLDEPTARRKIREYFEYSDLPVPLGL